MVTNQAHSARAARPATVPCGSFACLALHDVATTLMRECPLSSKAVIQSGKTQNFERPLSANSGHLENPATRAEYKEDWRTYSFFMNLRGGTMLQIGGWLTR